MEKEFEFELDGIKYPFTARRLSGEEQEVLLEKYTDEDKTKKPISLGAHLVAFTVIKPWFEANGWESLKTDQKKEIVMKRDGLELQKAGVVLMEFNNLGTAKK